MDTFSIIPFFGNRGRRLFKIRNFPLCMEIVDSVSSKDTFSIIPFFENCERCLFHKFKKNWVYTEETLSIISIQTMENFEFMLKVSLQEIPSTIPKKMELYSDAFHNF